jgi:hypothetical protein
MRRGVRWQIRTQATGIADLGQTQFKQHLLQ